MLDKTQWRDLLRDIHNHQVVPVIGPDLVMVDDPTTGQPVSLYSFLAPKLAEALGLSATHAGQSLADVVRDHLNSGASRKQVYDELRELIDVLDAGPSPALVDLASITDFDLFITSTCDHQFKKALEQTRPGFLASDGVGFYHPTQPNDIPRPLTGPSVYHILGDYNTYPDFAVWDEDYMEFICGLLEHSDTLKNLFRILKSRFLLLLGAPSEDWIVRFFLRIAHRQRLSDRGRSRMDYLADRRERLGEPMIFFFDKLVGATHIIDGDPSAFVRELATRWRDRYGVCREAMDFLRQMPKDMPRGSVFISYSHDDIDIAARVGHELASAQIPVWLDRQRLQAGGDFERSLEHAVKAGCSFFIAIISNATEADASRYVHKERAWAAQAHVPGHVYYIPLLTDRSLRPRLEPPCFANIHADCCEEGQLSSAFLSRMRQLVNEYNQGGCRPRA